MKTTDDQNELFVVVDEEDNILGYYTRHACHNNRLLLHRGVIMYIFDDEGRVLLQKRSATKDTDPGFWSMSAGGHVGKGETYEVAMDRELREELGVELPIKFVEKFIFRHPRETEIDTLFVAKGNGPFYPSHNEVEEVKFFTKLDLNKKLQSSGFKMTKICRESLQKLAFLS